MGMASTSKKGKSPSGGNFSKKRKFEPKKPKTTDDAGKELSASNKKRVLKQERQSHRKHADVVVESKELWNKLRLKTNTKEQTQELMKRLMELLRGKVNEIAMQHDASRVVQAAIQFGSKEQKKEIITELCNDGNLGELSKVQYAHFVVLKVIKYCERDEECYKMVVKKMKGTISKLAIHAVGARVVELLFATFPTKATASLKQELYGPHFALFTDTVEVAPTLQANLEQVPNKKAVTLEFVLSLLNKGIEKSLFGFAYYQQLFSEYVAVASPSEIRSIGSSVVDHSIHFLSTRPGSIVVAACAAYGTPKDRKRIIKSLKGYTRSSLLHRDAYIAILRIVDVTDDTVSVHKSVLAEILVNPDDKDDEDDVEEISPLLDLALSDTASKLFLMLLVSDEETRHKYFDPFELKVLHENPTVKENGEEVPTSKKNPGTRRRELLQYCRAPLVELCTLHADKLLRSRSGARIMREVWKSFPSDEIATAVLEACVGEGGKDSKSMSMFEDPIGHLVLKNMILDESVESETKQNGPSFVSAFHDKFKGNLIQIASSNRGAFVLTALSKNSSVHGDVVKELNKNKAQLKKLVQGGQDEKGKKITAGYDALLLELGAAKKKK